MRVICVGCNITYNCDECADCIKCKGSVCQECLLFESGNYYCPECVVNNLKEDIGYIKRDMCFTNNLDTIKLLLEEGLDINEWGISGHTPIHLHVKEGNIEIVKYLLSKGADINKKNVYGDNVIDDALKYNQDDEIYNYLLDNMKTNIS